MARRSRFKNIEMELFPFLSILACTIGTLILLIIVITSQTLGGGREITIVAETETENGKNTSLTPRYIESQQEGIIIYPSKEFIPQRQLNQNNPTLQKLLSELKANTNNEYLIVAVRPDSIQVFKQLRQLIENEGIRIGYEPIEKHLELKIQEE